jgi:Leucine-rich repeat (LRR) protein
MKKMSNLQLRSIIIFLVISINLIVGQKFYPCATTYRYPHESEPLELTCYFYFPPNGQGSDHRIVSYHNKFIQHSDDEKVTELSFKLESTFEFPKTLFWKFVNVKLVSVEKPGASQINPKSFDGAEKLTELNFRSNSLQKLESESFLGAENLVHLDLAENKIRDIEVDTFKGLNKLEKLDLSGNEIEVFHNLVFDALAKLKGVDMSRNKIESLQEKLFDKNLELRNLKLSDNRLSVIPTNLFENLRHLESLDLQKNICIDATYSSANKKSRIIENELRSCSPPREIPENLL